MMKRLFEDRSLLLDLFEMVGILAILALLLAQVPVMGIPLSQMAGIGALYIALFGAARRLKGQNREDKREETREAERNRRKWDSEESDSPTVVYNVYGENAYIEAKPDRREHSDRALDQTPVEERAAHNKALDEFNPEGKESNRQESPPNTARTVNGEETKRESEFEL